MSYSVTSYTGDGSTVNFAVPFPFVSRSHVIATVNGVVTAFTWLTDGLIQFATAPINTAVVRIYRNTSQAVRLVDFQDATVLTEEALDTANLQAFYMAQEAFDASAAVMNSAELNAAVAAAAESALEAAASAVLAGGYASAALGYLNSNLKTSDRFEIVAVTQFNEHPDPSAEEFSPELVLTNNFAAVNHRKWKMAVFNGDAFALGPENDVEDSTISAGINMTRASGGGNDVVDMTLRATTLNITGLINLSDGQVTVPAGLGANSIPLLKFRNATAGDSYVGITPGGTGAASPRLIFADREHADHVQMRLSIETGNYAELAVSAVGAGTVLPFRITNAGTERMRFHASVNRQTIGAATDDGSHTLQVVGSLSVSGASALAGVVTWGSGNAATPGITPAGDPDTGLWSPGANTLAWSTAGVERMRIDATGVVTIGGAGIPTVPTGTGFPHIVAGVQDAAAKLIDTADINASQVTYAKIQNVSATAKLLGRVTAGAGVIEEIAFTTFLQTAGGTMTGDIAFGNKNASGVKSVTFNGEIDDGTKTTTATIDFTTGQYHKCLLTASTGCTFTFTAPNGPAVVHLKIVQPSSGTGAAMTLPSGKWPGSYAAGDKLLSTANNAIDLLTAKWDGAAWFYTLSKAWA